jgi:hypothetical protein
MYCGPRSYDAGLAYDSTPMSDPGDERPDPDSRRPALIGLAVVLVLVVASYFLVTALQRNASLEDCLMSGRRNCAPIEAPAPAR